VLQTLKCRPRPSGGVSPQHTSRASWPRRMVARSQGDWAPSCAGKGCIPRASPRENASELRACLPGLTPKKRGRKASGRDPLRAENATNDRLTQPLRQAEIIIDVQKKYLRSWESRSRRYPRQKGPINGSRLQLAPDVGFNPACASLKIPCSGFYRRQAQHTAQPVEPRKRPSPPEERQEVLDRLQRRAVCG
jgi:hypothetical protein